MAASGKTAFVLGGGGKWGAVEVGMVQALDEASIHPDLVLGTSIGAFNGSVIADQPGKDGVQRLFELWESLSNSEVFKGGMFERIRNVATFQPAIHSTEDLRSILESFHGPDKRIEDLSVTFQCVAASIERSAEHWFTSGPLMPALLASSAVPALFPPVKINDEHFYDGGLVNSVPLDRAFKLGAKSIFVLQVGRIEAPLRPPERLHEAGLISFEIARRHTFARAMENVPDDVELHLLPSGNPVAFDDRRQIKWKDMANATNLMAGAYEATTKYLSDLR